MAKRSFDPTALVNKVAASTSELETSTKVIDLPITLIDENPYNEAIFDMSDIERLASQIRTGGFEGAINVFKKEDGRYQISSGHRRFRASKLAGKTKIPAIVTPMPDEVTVRESLIKSNILSRNISPLEKARAMVFYKEALQMKYGTDQRADGHNINEEIAEVFGVSKDTVKKLLRIMNLIPSLQKLVGEERIPWGKATTIHAEPEDIQKKIYEACVQLLESKDEEDERDKKISSREFDDIVFQITGKGKEEEPAVAVPSAESKKEVPEVSESKAVNPTDTVEKTPVMNLPKEPGQSVVPKKKETKTEEDSVVGTGFDGISLADINDYKPTYYRIEEAENMLDLILDDAEAFGDIPEVIKERIRRLMEY